MSIHSSAIVSPGAELSENVSVGPFSIIEDEVKVGAGTVVGPHVLIAKGTSIGRDCSICYGAVLGTAPQDLKYRDEETTLEIGDRTVIREFASLNRGTNARQKTVVGSDCLIMTYAHIAHDCLLGNYVIIENAVNLSGHVTVEDFAIIGGVVPVHQFVKIGQHSFIGGGSRVSKDVPPFIKSAGEPLRPVGLNLVGLRRRRFSTQTIAALKKAYRILFRSNLNTSQAVERISTQVEQIEEIRILLEFIKNSQRGIIK
ncbi:MAG: acyl-ACP--UDP-N-acetylglucosamine O-acyltransferase [Candidatus Latescibacteria bacterium]|nr:acyl-ACP--UDP-N-acetylglucosamine O-acyltransferase [Candidatus Latescibacterota bacterium]